MPKAIFTMSGEIAAFDRIDDVYKALKREGSKLLLDWEITVTAEFKENISGIIQ